MTITHDSRIPTVAHTTTPTIAGVKESSIVAVYGSHAGAEQAITDLQRAGFDMKRLSIVGKDFRTEEHAVGFYTAGDRMRFWGAQGAFWGSLWGMLFGSALFFIPVVGHLIVLGPMVGWIVGALEGAVVGGAAGALGGALSSIGVPDDSIVKYESELKTGKFLVIARGSGTMMEGARSVLSRSAASEVTTHQSA